MILRGLLGGHTSQQTGVKSPANSQQTAANPSNRSLIYPIPRTNLIIPLRGITTLSFPATRKFSSVLLAKTKTSLLPSSTP